MDLFSSFLFFFFFLFSFVFFYRWVALIGIETQHNSPYTSEEERDFYSNAKYIVRNA